MTYEAEYEDNEIEILTESSDDEAITCAFRLEKDHGSLFNLTLLDEDYNKVRTII